MRSWPLLVYAYKLLFCLQPNSSSVNGYGLQELVRTLPALFLFLRLFFLEHDPLNGLFHQIHPPAPAGVQV